mmetsp:Transcript_57815/g.158832  ORF Transcript_57815/g.158832 Transcript_57815/m.158832 type:complete len:285 (-) Transcript_57815:277-1131(-)
MSAARNGDGGCAESRTAKSIHQRPQSWRCVGMPPNEPVSALPDETTRRTHSPSCPSIGLKWRIQNLEWQRPLPRLACASSACATPILGLLRASQTASRCGFKPKGRWRVPTAVVSPGARPTVGRRCRPPSHCEPPRRSSSSTTTMVSSSSARPPDHCTNTSSSRPKCAGAPSPTLAFCSIVHTNAEFIDCAATKALTQVSPRGAASASASTAPFVPGSPQPCACCAIEVYRTARTSGRCVGTFVKKATARSGGPPLAIIFLDSPLSKKGSSSSSHSTMICGLLP